MTTDTTYGIDLGTTYSALAHLTGDAVEVVPNRHGRPTTPSVVHFGPAGVLVGEEAKREQSTGDEDTVSLFKRYMGNPNYLVEAGGRHLTPAACSAEVLKELVAGAARAGRTVRRAVVTVPAYFKEPQRRDTLAAAKLAGLEVRQLISEPAAAALAFAMEKRRGGTFLVYDLGGGTFDVAVVRIEQSNDKWVVVPLAYDGNAHLGGRDWDEFVIQHVAAHARNSHGVELLPPGDLAAHARWAVRAEEIKVELSSADQVVIPYQVGAAADRVTYTRREFEAQSAVLTDRTLGLCDSALRSAGLRWDQVMDVLLVGGSTRMPMIPAAIQKKTGRPPSDELNPDEAVARGAAVVAAGLDGRAPAVEIREIVAFTLGIVLVSRDGTRWVNRPVIARNRSVGESGTYTFAAAARPDESGTLEIYVTQGEALNPASAGCQLLARFVATGLPAGHGPLKIETRYTYTPSGTVSVTARVVGGPELAVTREDDLDKSRFGTPPPQPEPVTVVLAIDLSGSMSQEGRFEAVRDAGRKFLSALTPGSRLGVITYTYQSQLACSPTADQRAITRALDGLSVTWDGTRFHPPLAHAAELFRDVPGQRVLIFMTDGERQDESLDVAEDAKQAVAAADLCRGLGVTVLTVGTPGAHLQFLERLGPLRVAEGADLTTAILSIGTDLTAGPADVPEVTVDYELTEASHNLFIDLRIDPDTPADRLPGLLDEAKLRLSGMLSQAGHGQTAGAILDQFGAFGRLLADPAALEEARTEAGKLRAEQHADAARRIDELLADAASADGCVTSEDLDRIAARTGRPADEVRRIAADGHGYAVVPVVADEPFPVTDEVTARDIATKLAVAGKGSLYELVGTAQTAPDGELQRRINAAREKEGREGGTDQAAAARDKLLGYAALLLSGPATRREYDNALEWQRLDAGRFADRVRTAAGTGLRLALDKQEELLAAMVGAGATPAAAKAYLILLRYSFWGREPCERQ